MITKCDYLTIIAYRPLASPRQIESWVYIASGMPRICVSWPKERRLCTEWACGSSGVGSVSQNAS
jgi:hypothetical protein